MRKSILIVGLIISLFVAMNPVFAGRYYIPEIGRWATPDPHAQNYPHLSPYCYAANNPLRFIDPDGYDLADVHKIVTAIHTTLNKAWKNSFNKNGTVAEVSGAIVSKDNSIYAKNIRKGTSVADMDYTTSAGETLEGGFHTHPYSKAEGGFTGVGFSAGDIVHQGWGEETGAIMIVEAGTKRFALEISDAKKASNFVKNSDVQKMWDSAFKKAYKKTKNFQQSVIKAFSTVILENDSGIRVYQSVDDEKKKFEEIK